MSVDMDFDLSFRVTANVNYSCWTRGSHVTQLNLIEEYRGVRWASWTTAPPAKVFQFHFQLQHHQTYILAVKALHLHVCKE